MDAFIELHFPLFSDIGPLTLQTYITFISSSYGRHIVFSTIIMLEAISCSPRNDYKPNICVCNVCLNWWSGSHNYIEG